MATPSEQDLLDAIKRMQRIKNKYGIDLEKALKHLFADFFKNVYKSLAKDQLTPTDRMDAASRAKILDKLNGYLVNAGYKDFIQTYKNSLPEMQDGVFKYYKLFGKAPVISNINEAALTNWVKQTELNLKQGLSVKLVTPLQNLVLQNTIGGVDKKDVATSISQMEEGLSYKQSLVTVNTYIAQYQRMNQVAVGDEVGLEIYQYLGPDDDITSPQCKAMLDYDEHDAPGFAYKDEITADMVDGLRDNPLFNGGHPGCRHQWLPVTLEYAQDKGFKK